jgi:DeoR/GlpR family transcriptional regulator of sugar metabolism
MKKQINANEIIKTTIKFLQLIMTETLAKRIVSMILIVVGTPDARVTELTGLCDRSVRTLRKKLEDNETEGIFQVHGGGGKSKLVDFESAIIEEIETGNYTNRQQIADMINEKHGVTVSLNTISNFLKKTASNG